MKRKYLILLVPIFLVSLNSCLQSLLPIRGNGVIVTETRRCGDFYKVENSTSIDVIYKKADTTGITITADENLLEYIITETYDNTLEIKFKPQNTFLDFSGQPLIKITSPDLESVFVSGSSAFFADKMAGDNITLKLSGSGDISVDSINCNNLAALISGSGNINVKECSSSDADIFLSGSGNISLKGNCEAAEFKISGSGEIFSENFITSSSSVLISGSGNAFVNVENNLNGVISGSGNIYLRGDPEISQTISGSGRIIKYK